MNDLSNIFDLVFYYPPPKSVKINGMLRSLIDEWVIQVKTDDTVLYQMDLESVYYTSEKIRFLDDLCTASMGTHSSVVLFHPVSLGESTDIKFIDYTYGTQWEIVDFKLQREIQVPHVPRDGETSPKLLNIIQDRNKLLHEVYTHTLYNLKDILKWCGIRELNQTLLKDIIKFLLIRKQVWVFEEMWTTFLNKYYTDYKNSETKYVIDQVVQDIARYRSGDSNAQEWCKEEYFADCVSQFKLSNSTGDLTWYLSEHLEDVVGTKEELNDLFTIASFMIKTYVGFESVYHIYDMIHVFSQNLKQLDSLDQTDYTKVYSENEFGEILWELLNNPPVQGTLGGVPVMCTMWTIVIKLQNGDVKYVNKLGLSHQEVNNIINNLFLLLKTNLAHIELKGNLLIEGITNANTVYFKQTSKLPLTFKVIKNTVITDFKIFKKNNQYYVRV
jgi:hypothetical protein